MVQLNIDRKNTALFLSISKQDYCSKQDPVPWAVLVRHNAEALGWTKHTLHITVRDYFKRGKPLMTKMEMDYGAQKIKADKVACVAGLDRPLDDPEALKIFGGRSTIASECNIR